MYVCSIYTIHYICTEREIERERERQRARERERVRVRAIDRPTVPTSSFHEEQVPLHRKWFLCLFSYAAKIGSTQMGSEVQEPSINPIRPNGLTASSLSSGIPGHIQVHTCKPTPKEFLDFLPTIFDFLRWTRPFPGALSATVASMVGSMR